MFLSQAMDYEINNKGTLVGQKQVIWAQEERRGQGSNNRNRKYGLKVREEDRTLIIGCFMCDS